LEKQINQPIKKTTFSLTDAALS